MGWAEHVPGEAWSDIRAGREREVRQYLRRWNSEPDTEDPEDSLHWIGQMCAIVTTKETHA